MIERGGRLDFDAMQMRLHPGREPRSAGSPPRSRRSSSPSTSCSGRASRSHELPLEKRRASLEKLPFTISPGDARPDAGAKWLDQLEAAGLDGVIAKRLGLPYLPGSREACVKVKAHKTADCVVVGVRWKAKPTTLATLLLGLYREDGELDYVGSAAVAASRHDEILKRVKPLLKGAPDRGFSEPNRWGTGELERVGRCSPKLVVEVRYDKVQGNRFRHGTKLIRFRDDKDPGSAPGARCASRRGRTT